MNNIKKKLFVILFFGIVICWQNGIFSVSEPMSVENMDYALDIEVFRDGYVFYIADLSDYDQANNNLSKKKVYVGKTGIRDAMRVYEKAEERGLNISRVDRVYIRCSDRDRINNFIKELESINEFPPKLLYSMIIQEKMGE